MKIFDREQIYQIDKQTIQNQNITQDELMERVGTRLFAWLDEQLPSTDQKIVLFCGVGNNGGDGLVLARLLLLKGYEVTVHVVNFGEGRTEGFLKNLDRLKENKLWPNFISEDSDFPTLQENEIVIDAIFGIGLTRSLSPWVASLVKHINEQAAYVIAIDVPSGLFLDKFPNDKEAIIQANFTVSFQLYKLIFFLPQTAKYIGGLRLLNIGLDAEAIHKSMASKFLMSKNDVLPLYRNRAKFSHKGSYGHALVVGGSYGKIGCVSLSSKAALRTGVGKLTALVPSCGYQILQTSVPEAMLVTSNLENELNAENIDFIPDVVCFGMGAGTGENAYITLLNLIEDTKNPMLIDADGINLLAKHPGLIEKLPEKTILTPHPGELTRLLGTWTDDFDKLEKCKTFSKTHKVIIVLKGAHTIVVAEDNLYVNTTGNPGMATAGSGDVLSGVITALLAQQYDPLMASILGVYLHGKAGDLAAQQNGYEALIASDIIAYMGKAFISLFQEEQKPAKEA